MRDELLDSQYARDRAAENRARLEALTGDYLLRTGMKVPPLTDDEVHAFAQMQSVPLLMNA